MESLAVFVLGVILCALLSTLRTDRLLALLIIACIFSRVMVEVGPAAVRPEHLAAVVIALSAFTDSPPRWLHAAWSFPSMTLLALIVWGIFVSVINGVPVEIYGTVTGWLAIDWLIMVSVASARFERDSAIRAVRYSVLFAGLSATTLWAISLTGNDLGGVQTLDTGSDVPAAYGFSHEANLLGAILALGIVVLVSYERKLSSVAGAVPVVAGFSGLLVSQTRAAMLGVAIALALLALSRRRDLGGRGRHLAALFLVASPIAFVVNPRLLTSTLLAKFTQLLDFSETNALYRLRVLGIAWTDLEERGAWISGLGVNSFGLRHYDPSRPGERATAYLSNLPTQLIYDTGFTGLVLAITLLVALKVHRDRVALAVATCFLLVSLSTSILWFAPVWLLAGLRLGVLLGRAPGDGARPAVHDRGATPARDTPKTLRA